jgi:hypothetical protein
VQVLSVLGRRPDANRRRSSCAARSRAGGDRRVYGSSRMRMIRTGAAALERAVDEGRS